MKYRKILLAYNGSQEGKRALLECADLASFLGAETHLLAVASMPPSLFLTEGFVPEELLEEEKKRTQSVLDEGIRTLRERGYNAVGHLSVGEPVEEICRLAKSLDDPEYLKVLAQLDQPGWYKSSEDYAKWAAETLQAERATIERVGLLVK